MRLLCVVVLVAFGLPWIAVAQTAAPWPEADKLFHSDPRWLGSDAAFSVDLGGNRTLWLFNDTFVARKTGDSRRQAAFVRNTVAIQTGYDPSLATIKFYWRTSRGAPSEIFPSEGKMWMWPAHGIRIEDRLLLFCSRMAPDNSKNSLGFRSAGWVLYVVSNPDQEPTRWDMRKVREDHQGNFVLASAVLHDDTFVYLVGYTEPEHDLYLARWTLANVRTNQFDRLEWWSGTGWQTDPSHRQAIIRNGSTEASVQRAPDGEGFIEVNSEGFGASDIVMRRAPQLTGPWSEPRKIYRPPESDAADPFVYAGKSHPELHGADVVLTYATNSLDNRVATDMSIYFPRFVKVQLSPRN